MKETYYVLEMNESLKECKNYDGEISIVFIFKASDNRMPSLIL